MRPFGRTALYANDRRLSNLGRSAMRRSLLLLPGLAVVVGVIPVSVHVPHGKSVVAQQAQPPLIVLLVQGHVDLVLERLALREDDAEAAAPNAQRTGNNRQRARCDR